VGIKKELERVRVSVSVRETGRAWVSFRLREQCDKVTKTTAKSVAKAENDIQSRFWTKT